MVWDVYTTFSVVTGVLMVALAFVPDLTTKQRAGSALFGVALVVYGLYVGHATSGTYPFPLWIFLAPFYVLFHLGRSAWSRHTNRSAAESSAAPAATGNTYTPAFAGAEAASADARPFVYRNAEKP